MPIPKIAQGTTTNATAARGREEFKQQRSLQGSQLQQDAPRAVSAVQDLESGLEMNVISNGGGFSAVSATENGYDKIASNAVMRLFFRHMYATLLKRFLVFKRDFRSFVFLYFVPVLFLLIGVLIVALVNSITVQPSKTLGSHLYNSKVSTSYFPVPFSNGSQFCYPSEPCLLIDGQDQVFEDLGSFDQLPMLPVNDAESVYDISEYLFDHRSDRQASTFGAFTLTNVAFSITRSLRSVSYILHGNFTARHAGPVMQSIMANSIISSFDSSASVTSRIHPLPLTKVEREITQSRNVDNIVTFLLLAIPYVPASFASFLVKEREIKAKHQQLVSGVSVLAYWLSTWLWDFISYQPTCWMFVIMIASCPGAELLTSISTGALGCMIGLLLLFGSSISSFSYLISMLFSNPSMTQIILIFIMFILGLILGIVGIVLRILYPKPFLRIIRYILCIFPPFALADGLHNLTQIQSWSWLELGGTDTYQPSDWRITGLPLAFLAWETVVYLLLVIIIEYLRLIPSFSGYFASKPKIPEDNTYRDADVTAESARIHNDRDAVVASSNVLIDDVKKVFSGGKFAVRGVSLGIPKGECFGLLGINGAGKSTLLGMLSGELLPSAGSMYLGGLSLQSDIHNCRRLIGFCPQFDALFELLTGREHLQLYARIKGIVDDQIDAAVNAKISEMGLTEYADRAAGTYSGGNKRKLSVAIAMIGDPAIAFLDEPSTGMDPVARRFMWDVISDMVNRRVKCSVILTTHSMEECEALCTRIGIMVGGVLRCLGSSQHLRSLYGHGFQLEFGMVLPSSDQIQQQAQALAQAAGKTVQDTHALLDLNLTRSEVTAAFTALGLQQWVDRINLQGSGVDLVNAFETNGSVSCKYLSTWCIFEQNFERMCNFLISSFGSFVLRERQNHKVRVEITSYLNQVAAVGPNGALIQTPSQPGEAPIARNLSEIFGVIEKNKVAIGIQEYSVSQTSLEQIFNQFAAQQEEERGHAQGL